jgi:hypothetical protein
VSGQIDEAPVAGSSDENGGLYCWLACEVAYATLRRTIHKLHGGIDFQRLARPRAAIICMAT